MASEPDKAACDITLSSDGYFGCACDKVRIDVIQPMSSNWVVKPTAALCQCTDCVSFASSVAAFRRNDCGSNNDASDNDKADALTPSNAVDMRQIFKSDAVQLAGAEHLRAVKLREDSPSVRYYSACCGTALMMDYLAAPFFLVFQNTINNTISIDPPKFQRLTPSCVLNHQSAPPDSLPTPEGIPVRDGVSIGFISHAVARAIWGMLSGKKQSAIQAQLDSVPVTIGIDSIGKSKNENDTDN